jgi:hypothetical protein
MTMLRLLGDPGCNSYAPGYVGPKQPLHVDTRSDTLERSNSPQRPINSRHSRHQPVEDETINISNGVASHPSPYKYSALYVDG